MTYSSGGSLQNSRCHVGGHVSRRVHSCDVRPLALFRSIGFSLSCGKMYKL